MLMVSPIADRQMIEASTDSGIEIVMIRVLRQVPRNSSTISAGECGGDGALAHHAVDRSAHEQRLIAGVPDVDVLGSCALIAGSSRLICSMICSVEAPPVLSTDISTE